MKLIHRNIYLCLDKKQHDRINVVHILKLYHFFGCFLVEPGFFVVVFVIVLDDFAALVSPGGGLTLLLAPRAHPVSGRGLYEGEPFQHEMFFATSGWNIRCCYFT